VSSPAGGWCAAGFDVGVDVGVAVVLLAGAEVVDGGGVVTGGSSSGMAGEGNAVRAGTGVGAAA
jgi:hypothetical protein